MINNQPLPPAFGGPDPLDVDYCDCCGSIIGFEDVKYGAFLPDDSEQVFCGRCGKAFWDSLMGGAR